MKKQFNMTIELSEDEIRRAIAEYITRNLDNSQLKVHPAGITFQTQTQTDFRGERMGTKLVGAKASVKSDTVPEYGYSQDQR